MKLVMLGANAASLLHEFAVEAHEKTFNIK